MSKESIWITWEDHRRSRELAHAFQARYVAFTHKGSRYIRYPILSFRTLIFLVKNRAGIVYCQNPSIVLNFLLCVLKPFFKYQLIVDRHSNFKFHTSNSKRLEWILFHWLSKFTIRNSDLTIVTNAYLKDFVDGLGGHGYVLQDKLPALTHLHKQELKGRRNFVFISTFSADEPIHEVIAAARLIDLDYHIYITGGYKKFQGIDLLLKTLPKNVTLTGFLPEPDYQSLLYSAEAVIVITDQEYTLTCGAYEAVALDKPMILGNTETIKEYFSQGAVYTQTTAQAIAESLDLAINALEKLKVDVIDLRKDLGKDWDRRFHFLLNSLQRPPNI